jgi:hypothetical protein
MAAVRRAMESTWTTAPSAAAQRSVSLSCSCPPQPESSTAGVKLSPTASVRAPGVNLVPSSMVQSTTISNESATACRPAGAVPTTQAQR